MFNEYRLRYHWDTGHWTCITGGSLKDCHKYIQLNASEMEDALEEWEDAFFTLEYCNNNTRVAVWEGTPTELLDIILELDS